MTRYIQISGSQLERLVTAVLMSFDRSALRRLLYYRLDLDLDNLVADSAFEDTVFLLLRTAQQQGFLADLLLAFSEARPGHAELEALRTELSLGKSTTADGSRALEGFVQGVGGLLDPEVLRVKLAKAEAAVCRISYPRPDGRLYGGTGFLVGPDIVMTNYHVMKYVIDDQVDPAAVTALFDYKLDGDGNKINQGNPFGLADLWLIDSSPYSATDLQQLANVPDTPADELDYALIRLNQRVGCRPISTNVPGNAARGAGTNDPARGWIQIPDHQPAVAPHSPLLILQHPEIGMMKLSWDPDAVLAVNGSRTRIRHATATLPGSSGSPCFDASFNVVALHHAGDPAETVNIPATYNQAIPMRAIIGLLGQRGRDGALREQCPAE